MYLFPTINCQYFRSLRVPWTACTYAVAVPVPVELYPIDVGVAYRVRVSIHQEPTRGVGGHNT